MRPHMAIDGAHVDHLNNFMMNEPNMQACFKRLMNAALANDVEFNENNSKINSKLNAILVPHYRIFLKNVMQQCFICGFCAIYIRKPHGVALPYVMPMGSFTWSIEVNGAHSKRRKYDNGNSVCRYKIEVVHGPISENDIHVVNWRDPVLFNTSTLAVHSPIDHLLTKFERLEKTFQVLTECNKWNSEKHVAITESVDLKDQTTSGIQLLDEMRRYTLTGQHGHGPTGVMRMKSRDNHSLNTVNDATMHWLRDQFQGNEAGKNAFFHCLPANMNVQELSTIEAGRELQIILQDFSSSVYAFFDVPRLTDIGGSNTISSGEQMSRHQYLNVLATCQFMEYVATVAYCVSFGVEMGSVKIVISPQTRLEVHSAADIKALADAEILTDADKKNIKRLFTSKTGNF